jgi:very-short-patch-repair endonuclease
MHFQDEGETLYVASDMERQDVLERAGWEFYRLRYSDWLVQRDKPQAIMNEIRNALTA